jgi:hypothetical protein
VRHRRNQPQVKRNDLGTAGLKQAVQISVRCSQLCKEGLPMHPEKSGIGPLSGDMMASEKGSFAHYPIRSRFYLF